jgi:ArsR family transcriptional regulator
MRLADILKALAHPARLRIVAVLCDGEETVIGIAERLDIKQAIVSQQLRILRMSGLVAAARENGFARYGLAEPRLRELIACLGGCQRDSQASEQHRRRQAAGAAASTQGARKERVGR